MPKWQQLQSLLLKLGLLVGAKNRATTAVTAVCPTGTKSVGVGENSCQKTVEVDQFMQRAQEQLLKMVNERALRFLEKLRVRCMNA